MPINKAQSRWQLLVFPVAFFLIYWAEIYFYHHPIEQLIPEFVTFLSLGVLFSMEQIFPYEKAVSQRKLALRDIVSTLVNMFVTGTVLGFFFTPFVYFIPYHLFGRSTYFAPGEIGPLWLQFVLAMLLFSFLRYWVHRAQHILPFLWELHSYHHSVTDLRASNTLHSHPIDYAVRNILPPLILYSIGFDPVALLFGLGLLNTAAVVSHCGAGLRATWFNHLFVTPEVHRWHHSAKVPEGHRYAVNYGVGTTLWDRLFRTYYLPTKDDVPVQPDELGHPDGVPDEPNYLKFLFLTRYLPKFFGTARS